ncbi:hypothetical protein [Natronorubrum sp. FCH18a]|uniref:hypothetical protein n=1 Tax=Natronorubrum sp. FCH18a TaxID=3447018 RepID=UPI003F50DC76
MFPLSRREAIRLGSVVCSTSLAGCIDLSWSEEQEARLTKIALQNHTADEQSVLVIVEDEGEQVYGEFTAVPPADGDSPTVREVEDVPEEPGVYDVYFNLARRPEDIEGEFWATADNTDITCREYRLDIKPDDRGEPQFGIYRSDGC